MIRATKAQTAYFLLQKLYLSREKASDVDELAKGLVAVPVPFYLTPFLASHARIGENRINAVLAAMLDERSLLKRPAMRNLPYLVSVDDFAMFLVATQRQRRQHFNREFITWQVEAAEIEALAEAIITEFGDGIETVDAIVARLPESNVGQLTQTSRGGRVSYTSNVALALSWLEADGQLINTHLGSEARYTRTSIWLPHVDLASKMSEAEAQSKLVRAYLSTYGPASEADISFWTGFGKSETQRAVSTLSGETTLTMVEGIPGALLLLKDQADALRVTKPADRPTLNLLPADDPFVTAHKATRTRLLSNPRLQRQIFSSTDHAKPTIVIDGSIVGIWEFAEDDQGRRIEWRLFEEIGAEHLPELEAKLNIFATYYGAGIWLKRIE